jgi:virginiamycin A acetyltransferase
MTTVPYLKDHFTESWCEIGEHTYGLPKVIGGGSSTKLKIGKYCSISDNVVFLLAGDHHVDFIATFPFDNIDCWGYPFVDVPYHRPNEITVGNDVWFGYGCVILHGLTIGDGAVIGAGAVVTKDVRPYAIVGGNPAKEIRRRFDDETITKLLSIRWWDFEDEKVKANLSIIESPDVEALCSI